jgi:predicted XRE-type DNA-binding protein
MRAGTLQTHVRQIDSAVNLKEYPDRVHPDHDRYAPGVRVVIGPETRSLLRQLHDSRDLRVQQQLVREIIHQVQKRALAAVRRAKAVEKTREAVSKAARGSAKAGSKAARSTVAAASRAWSWARLLGGGVRHPQAARASRAGGAGTVTRTRHMTSVRGRGAVPYRGRFARKLPAARTRAKRG